MTNEKYEILTDEEHTKTLEDGTVVHRIRALRDLVDAEGYYTNTGVLEGTLGGWVENTWNLSQSGTCWIYDDATVIGNATVKDDAGVHKNALVRDNAEVYGNAEVGGNATVRDNASVRNDASISGNAMAKDNATISDEAAVKGNATIGGEAKIQGYTHVHDNAIVCGQAWLAGDDVVICDNATIGGSIDIVGGERTADVLGRMEYRGIKIGGDVVLGIGNFSNGHIVTLNDAADAIKDQFENSFDNALAALEKAAKKIKNELGIQGNGVQAGLTHDGRIDETGQNKDR